MVRAESRTRRVKPQVMLLLDSNKKPISERRLLDLRDARHGDSPVEIIDSLEPGAYDLNPEEIGL